MFRILATLLAGSTLAGAAFVRSDDLAGTTSAAGKTISDAVVWLEAPDAPRAAVRPPAVLEQRQLQFFPHVLVVQVGTKVKFPNDDRVFHNVFSYHEGKPFDLGLYPVGTVRDVPFAQPGLSRIFCNIHPQMAAYVMVVDTPYFAVSDEAGRFTIHGVPAGNYPYHAWRPGGSILNATIDVRAGTSLEVHWP
jgi:plastocyanin